MNARKLNIARMEAFELIERIDECLQTANEEHKARGERWSLWYYASPRDTAAVRRQSMELTRALADLRRPS